MWYLKILYHVVATAGRNYLPIKNPVLQVDRHSLSFFNSAYTRVGFHPALLRSQYVVPEKFLEERDQASILWRTTEMPGTWLDNSSPHGNFQLRFAPSYSWALPRGKNLPVTSSMARFFHYFHTIIYTDL